MDIKHEQGTWSMATMIQKILTPDDMGGMQGHYTLGESLWTFQEYFANRPHPPLLAQAIKRENLRPFQTFSRFSFRGETLENKAGIVIGKRVYRFISQPLKQVKPFMWSLYGCEDIHTLPQALGMNPIKNPMERV